MPTLRELLDLLELGELRSQVKFEADDIVYNNVHIEHFPSSGTITIRLVQS
jgi:hypothetical protein